MPFVISNVCNVDPNIMRQRCISKLSIGTDIRSSWNMICPKKLSRQCMVEGKAPLSAFKKRDNGLRSHTWVQAKYPDPAFNSQRLVFKEIKHCRTFVPSPI